MGIASSKNNSESLNWDKINTESMSSTVPNLNTINKDAQKLVSNLNIENNIDLEQMDKIIKDIGFNNIKITYAPEHNLTFDFNGYKNKQKDKEKLFDSCLYYGETHEVFFLIKGYIFQSGVLENLVHRLLMKYQKGFIQELIHKYHSLLL